MILNEGERPFTIGRIGASRAAMVRVNLRLPFP
jgi:hypothetical protein